MLLPSRPFRCRHWSRLQHSSCQSSTLPSGPPLAGPNGRPIACWGDKPVQLVLNNRRFQWTFLLAAVQCPIITVDFIRVHHLLVDPFNNRLLDLSTFRSLKADTDKPQLHSPGVSSVDKMEGVVLRPTWPTARPLGPLLLHFLPQLQPLYLLCIHRRLSHPTYQQR